MIPALFTYAVLSVIIGASLTLIEIAESRYRKPPATRPLTIKHPPAEWDLLTVLLFLAVLVLLWPLKLYFDWRGDLPGDEV